MGGSEYRNTANKIEKTPHHRKQNRTNTASPQEILSTHRHRKIYLVLIFFFKKNVITATSTFQTKEKHHKTFLPQSLHVKFLAVAYISLGDTKMSQTKLLLPRQCFRLVSLASSEVRIHSHKK